MTACFFLLCITILPTTFSIVTPFYGGTGGYFYSNLNQTRISQIKNWGAQSNFGVMIVNWTRDFDIQLPSLGDKTDINVNCQSVIMKDNEYIDGYRMVHDNYIRLLGFHISNGNTFECSVTVAWHLLVNVGTLSDTQWIVYQHQYLSGFRAQSGSVIDGLQLLFNDSLVINCDSYECQYRHFTCYDNIDCIINCLGNYSCFHLTLYCPLNANCTVYCLDAYSCQYSTINASISSRLDITSGGNKATQYITVFCPNDGDQHLQQCRLYDTYNGDGQYKGITIYAVESWDDVYLNCGVGTYCTENGIMHCSIGYINQCSLKNDIPECTDFHNICSIYTYNPTIDPTNVPTVIPTDDPSMNPSTNPTTENPTGDPTINPTVIPTTTSTLAPLIITPSPTMYELTTITKMTLLLTTHTSNDNMETVVNHYGNENHGSSVFIYIITGVIIYICCLLLVILILLRNLAKSKRQNHKMQIEMRINNGKSDRLQFAKTINVNTHHLSIEEFVDIRPKHIKKDGSNGEGLTSINVNITDGFMMDSDSDDDIITIKHTSEKDKDAIDTDSGEGTTDDCLNTEIQNDEFVICGDDEIVNEQNTTGQ